MRSILLISPPFAVAFRRPGRRVWYRRSSSVDRLACGLRLLRHRRRHGPRRRSFRVTACHGQIGEMCSDVGAVVGRLHVAKGIVACDEQQHPEHHRRADRGNLWQPPPQVAQGLLLQGTLLTAGHHWIVAASAGASFRSVDTMAPSRIRTTWSRSRPWPRCASP